ncbi:MAG: GH36 C-terminal domain-containing protein, partial [Chthoniobacterales bacterium]
DWAQITDNWHPEEQLRTFSGLSLSMPPEQCVLWVGAINMHEADVDFVIRAGLLGQFCIAGIAPSPEAINEPGLLRWQHGVSLFKQYIRPIMPTCRLYHHTLSQDMQKLGDWVVLEMVSEDQRSAVVTLFRLQSSESPDYVFKPRGLDPSLKYKILLDNENRSFSRDGMELRNSGIPIRIAGTMQSELLVIQAE